MVCVFVATVLGLQTPEPTILALTPVFDGRIVAEEWMAAPGSSGSFVQWEPGVLHFASTVALDEDVVLSLDVEGDGWLRGTDNREVRVRFVGGKPVVRVRTIDSTGRGGPAWTSAKADGVTVTAAPSDGGWTVEGSVRLGDVAKFGRSIGVAVESAPSGSDMGPAYLPRTVSYVRLGYDQAEGLPEGMSWRSETRLREVARADGLTMRFSLTGAGDYDTAEVRCEGWGRDALTTITKQFQGFNSRGQASFEYKSEITDDGPAGWRVIRATLNNPDGSRTVLRTSFRLAELVEFDVDLPEKLAYSNEARTIRGRLDVRSTGVGRVEGQYDVAVERDWHVKKGGAQRLLIYNPRGRERINLEFAVPAGLVGTYPVTFTVSVGSMTFTRTVTVEIAPPA